MKKRIAFLLAGSLVVGALLLNLELIDRQDKHSVVDAQNGWKHVPVDDFVESFGQGPLSLATFAAMASNAYYPKNDIDADCDRPEGRIPIPDWHLEEADWSGDSPDQDQSGYAANAWTYQVEDHPPVLVLAFRGTNFGQLPDWCTNFGITGKFPGCSVPDQYQQAALKVYHLVERLAEELDPNTNIYAVGHSLGGGLAQLAGYVSQKVVGVYTFNSSPVIGLARASETYAELEAYPDVRAFYEHGEILQIPRRLSAMLLGYPENQGSLREYRFNLLDDDMVSQHSIKRLACALQEIKGR